MSEASQYCMNCGTPHPGHAKYCVKCGRSLANELLEQTAAPPHFDSTPLPLEGTSQAVDNTGDKVSQSVSSNEQVRGFPIGGTSTPRVKSWVGLPFAATLSFRNLQGGKKVGDRRGKKVGDRRGVTSFARGARPEQLGNHCAGPLPSFRWH
jgi:hypothetical protein